MRLAIPLTVLFSLSMLLVACGGKRAISDPAKADATPSLSLSIRAKGLKFDKNVLATTAAADVTLALDNQDAGALHNVSIYTDSSAKESLYRGDLITGKKTTEYRFRAPSSPGSYYFRCDAHPDMHGAFLVKP